MLLQDLRKKKGSLEWESAIRWGWTSELIKHYQTKSRTLISPYTKYAKYKACLPDLHVLQGLVIIDKSCAYSWARFCTGSRLDPFTLSRDRCQRVMVRNCKKVQYCKPVFVSVGILCEKAQQRLLLCKKVFSTISKTDYGALSRNFRAFSTSIN